MSVYFGWYLFETKATSEVVVLLDDSKWEILSNQETSVVTEPFVYYSTYSVYSGEWLRKPSQPRGPIVNMPDYPSAAIHVQNEQL